MIFIFWYFIGGIVFTLVLIPVLQSLAELFTTILDNFRAKLELKIACTQIEAKKMACDFAKEYEDETIHPAQIGFVIDSEVEEDD